MYANQKNTTAQTKAIKEQANINAQTSANNTRRIAAAQRAGFLNSGIALTGDGTAQSLFDETYDLGRTDISRIYSNANTEIANLRSKSRSNLLGTLGQTALTVMNK